MNILMVTMSLGIGGVETHITELTKELIRRGHRVTVASAGGVYVPEITASGASHVTLPLAGRSPIGLAQAYFGLRRLIKSGGFDVVHAHARIPCFICGLVRRTSRRKFAYVTTVHGVYKKIPVAERLTDWGDRSLVVSDDVRKYLTEEYGIKPENISVTVNGIDVDSFNSFSDEEEKRAGCISAGLAEESTHRIMHVSRLDSASSDAAYQLIEAMARLNEVYPDVQTVIIGDGSEFESVIARADEVNRSLGRRAVVMTGARSDVAKLLPCADAFVGVSRAALEAMSCRIPTVLAGAQGFLGIFDDSEEMLRRAQSTNFCCRGEGASSADAICGALISLFSLGGERLSSIGASLRSIIPFPEWRAMPRRCTAARLHSVGIDLRIFLTFARHFEDIHRSVIRPAERAPHRRTADVRCRIRYECTHGSYLRCRQMPPRVMMKSSAFGQHGQTEFRTLFCAAGFLSRRAYSPCRADIAASPS